MAKIILKFHANNEYIYIYVHCGKSIIFVLVETAGTDNVNLHDIPARTWLSITSIPPNHIQGH